jgi:hypothetical protein
MKFGQTPGKYTGESEERTAHEPAHSVEDAALDRVLSDFRSSVRAWSDAVYNRPRPIAAASRRAVWRKAAAWCVGSMLVIGAAGGGVLEIRHRQDAARIAAAREAQQQQRALAEEREREAEKELAKVDTDVAREVPNAMEPLAQLMTEDESR